MGMTTPHPHPQPDSPPPDVAQLQARIAELEAENVRLRRWSAAWKESAKEHRGWGQVYVDAAQYQRRLKVSARRAAAAWKRAATAWYRFAGDARRYRVLRRVMRRLTGG